MLWSRNHCWTPHKGLRTQLNPSKTLSDRTTILHKYLTLKVCSTFARQVSLLAHTNFETKEFLLVSFLKKQRNENENRMNDINVLVCIIDTNTDSERLTCAS